jgi:predicted DNA-binding protein
MPTFTMRLPEEDYEALQAMSLLTGRSMADLVRDAVSDSLTDFASSSELYQSFKEELRARELAMETLRQRLPADQRDVDGDSAAPEAPPAKRLRGSARKERAAASSRG